MDPERQRIQDDLRGLVEGEVRCDGVSVQMYASDASIFEIEPMGVVRPRGTNDVVACLQYAHENGLAIHPRGAGTGVAGGCLGRGVVLDFSHSMRRVIGIDGETARVQPGLVHAMLNRQLASRGRLFGPDPAGADVTTMGSVLAVNRGGSHWLRYGAARDKVVSLQIAMADGQVVELGKHAPNVPTTDSPPAERPVQLATQVAELIDRNRAVIHASVPKSLVNCSGYQLHDVYADGEVDLAKLLVGSEGTLGVITEATVATDPLPQHKGVALLFFDRIEKAANAVQELNKAELSACDLVDRRLLSLARDSDVRYDLLLPAAAEAVLLIEIEGDDRAEVRGQLSKQTNLICRKRKLAFDSVTTVDPADMQLFWQLAYRVLPTLYRLQGTQRPLPFVEDIAVPPACLADFIIRAQNVLKNYQTTASLFAHAGHGQLHLRPFLDLANPDEMQRMQNIASDLYEEVMNVGGTISGEHGNGLSRSWYVRRQFPELYAAFRELKRIFDPDGILNPSKITEPEPLQLTKSLRPVTTPPQIASNSVTDTNGSAAAAGADDSQQPTLQPHDSGEFPAIQGPIELLLNWDQREVGLAARSCNGCGSCRTQSDAFRMCPIFRFAPAEEASPRAKANLMRRLFTGHLHAEELADEEVKTVADLCVNCHQCRDECPANVDIPKLMIEYKAQYVATNGLSLSDWLLSRTDLLAQWASRVRWFANRALGNRRLRWALERFTGLAHGRKLPRLEKRSFLTVAKRRRLTRPTRGEEQKIVYFTDIYANWFDVQLAEAVLGVFQHNGVSVYVHPAQVQSGMSLVSVGAVEKAKVMAGKNIAILSEAIRQGYKVVASEPSAVLCLTREYPNMLGGDDVRLVADNTKEACDYLWQLHQRGKLELDFKPLHMTVGYHLPCHTRALGVGAPGQHLLNLIPGLTVRLLDKGCSGMAGTYGLKRENYRNSLRAGWPLISAIRDPILQIGVTECSACKIQMEQGTTKPTVHPLKLLALAYGLMPAVAEKFNARGEELYIS